MTLETLTAVEQSKLPAGLSEASNGYSLDEGLLIGEAADWVGLHPNTLRNLADSGDIAVDRTLADVDVRRPRRFARLAIVNYMKGVCTNGVTVEDLMESLSKGYRLVRVGKAAKRLHVHPHTLTRMEIPAFRIGKRGDRWYMEEHLINYLNDHPQNGVNLGNPI